MPRVAPGDAIPERRSAAARVAAIVQRFPWLIPAVSFGWGWLSFTLIQRGERLAQWIAGMVLLSWLWLLVEPLVRRRLERRRPGLGKLAANFLTQSLQQEMLFFALPFLLAATQRDAGQVAFTAITLGAAAITTLDPLYERCVAASALRRVLFQAYCSVIAAVVVLPIVVHLPVERALPLSLAGAAAWLLLTLPMSLSAVRIPRQALLPIGSALLAPLALWLLRAHVPPACLVVTQAVITQSLDQLVPGEPVKTVNPAGLADGVIAFAAIRAPMGLSQAIVFEWRHAEHIERILAEVHGGKESGFRTYSRKRAFPEGARGRWTVDILTPQRQLLQRLSFDVDPQRPYAPGHTPPPPRSSPPHRSDPGSGSTGPLRP